MEDFRWIHPVVVLLGLLWAWYELQQRYRSSLLSESQRIGVGLAAFSGAMIGSKVPFLLSPTIPSNWFLLGWLDGKTILGGIFGGYLSVELVKWLLSIKTRTGDYFAVPLAIAVCFGRIGCFFAGCCFGAPCSLPWACEFVAAGDRLSRHPTQLYEAAFHAAAAVALLVAEKNDWGKNFRLDLYLGSYLVFRFLTEWIRPEPRVWMGLTAYQLACLLLASLLFMHGWARQSDRHANPKQAE